VDVIFQKFIDFCRQRGVNPRKCDVPWINIFHLIFASKEHQRGDLVEVLKKIVEFHDKQVKLIFQFIL
jgi:hypothetical protein